MSSTTITVNVPEAKSSGDQLAKKLDASFDRLIKSLKSTTQPQQKSTDLSGLLKSQEKLLGAIAKLQKAVERQPASNGLEDALDRNWTAMQKTLKGLKEPKVSVNLPQAFYSRMDSLEKALEKPFAMRMPPTMSEKLDALAEAIKASRPKTMGILR